MEHKKRDAFTNRLGVIMAAAGSAVGLGNIWKFPGKAYAGGGGTFMIIYILIVILIGMPIMLAELSLGRSAQKNCVAALRSKSRRWAWVGWMSIIVPFIIACYYFHVGGWVIHYVAAYAVHPSAVFSDSVGYFYNFLGYDAGTGATWFPWKAILCAAIFAAMNAVVLIRGVSKGIEKFNKFAMPALFLLLIILLVRSVSLPGAQEGLQYMFHVDFSQVTFDTVLVALGQAFFSLSLGMGIMLTYGSYIPKTENLAKNTGIICCLDTLVALMAGFIIIPAVFATLGSDAVGMGGGFAFVSLAGVFDAMPGGQIFGVLFYLLLFFAALSSCMSIIEGIVAFFCEEFHMKRARVTIVICAIQFGIGILYTCSQAAFPIHGIWADIHGIQYPAFGDFMEYLTDRLLIPVLALLISIFVGWIWKPFNAIDEIEQNGRFHFRLRKVWACLIKFLAPLAILIIIVATFATGATLS